MGLPLTLDPALPRHAAIERALRDAIVDGRFAPGAQLPSTRALAAELGVARGTVVTAFEQLIAEGLLESRQGAPTRVAHVPPRPAVPEPPRRAPAVRADFFAGDPDLTLFPRAAWRAAVATVLVTAEAGRFGYGDPAGEPELRRALVDYLGRTRGVVARPEHVVVTAGFTHSLAVLGRALVATGHRSIAVEDPSFWRHREMLTAAGLRCEPVAVDADGLRVDDLTAGRSRAVLVTPAHHTPLGVSLAAPRRTALAQWAAAAKGGIVVEDDFDGELRFDRRPLRAIQSLDPDHVIYCGSASKALAPGMRISWCVAPAALVQPIVAAMASIGGQTVSRLDQLVLAELFTTGRYDAQVRRIRADYRARRDDLVAAVAARVPAVRVEGLSAGLKALLRLPPDTDEAAVVAALAERGVAVGSLEAFRSDPAAGAVPPELDPHGPALVVNYARPFAQHYRTALALLVDSLAEVLGERGQLRPASPPAATRPAGRTSAGARTPRTARRPAAR